MEQPEELPSRFILGSCLEGLLYQHLFIPEFVVGPEEPTILHFEWTFPEDSKTIGPRYVAMALSIGWNNGVPLTAHYVGKWRVGIKELGLDRLVVKTSAFYFEISRATFKELSGLTWTPDRASIDFTLTIEDITE